MKKKLFLFLWTISLVSQSFLYSLNNVYVVGQGNFQTVTSAALWVTTTSGVSPGDLPLQTINLDPNPQVVLSTDAIANAVVYSSQYLYIVGSDSALRATLWKNTLNGDGRVTTTTPVYLTPAKRFNGANCIFYSQSYNQLYIGGTTNSESAALWIYNLSTGQFNEILLPNGLVVNGVTLASNSIFMVGESINNEATLWKGSLDGSGNIEASIPITQTVLNGANSTATGVTYFQFEDKLYITGQNNSFGATLWSVTLFGSMVVTPITLTGTIANAIANNNPNDPSPPICVCGYNQASGPVFWSTQQIPTPTPLPPLTGAGGADPLMAYGVAIPYVGDHTNFAYIVGRNTGDALPVPYLWISPIASPQNAKACILTNSDSGIARGVAISEISTAGQMVNSLSKFSNIKYLW